MMKKTIFTALVVLFSCFGMAQKDLNNYKYIIVPNAYDFLSSEDQYQLNSITKFLFNKYGYTAFFIDDKLPEDLKTNRCLALTSAVSKEKGGMFKTKLVIDLKDCDESVIMTSQIGESRLKEYKKAYNEALRQAFETFKNFNYKYTSIEPNKQLKSEVEDLEQKDENEVNKSDLLIEANKNKHDEKEMSSSINEDKVLYAQPIEDGFQLVSSEPKIIMVLLTTAAKNVFIVKGKSAIVFKEDGYWYYSANDGKLENKKSMSIKF